MVGTIVCSRCKTEKPEIDFGRDHQSKTGKRCWCKKCANSYAKAHRKNNPAIQKSIRKSKLWTQYGITLADYEKMFNKQSGVCAICGQPPLDKALVVDHDHKTGKVRGLLCCLCNTMLGFAAESTKVLELAAQYLRKHTAVNEAAPRSEG